MSFVNFIGTALWVVIWPNGFRPVEILLTLGGFGLVGYFFYRVAYHLRRSQAQLTLSPFS
jgi:hypothetical protein